MYTVIGNETLTLLLNNWYAHIRARNIEKASQLKDEITKHMNAIEKDSNSLFFYLLLEFRYQYIIDNIGVSKNSFDKIDSLGLPEEESLAYYYHFFKGIHCSTIGNYNSAKKHYEKAGQLLTYISDPLEKAEYHYKIGAFHYDIYQAVLSLKEVTKAKELFEQVPNCETNIAFCENLLGLACTHLKEWELAEEYFTSAINTFQKNNDEKYILMVRQNLGLMYAGQNMSSLAIRYLSEVNNKMPANYKSLLVEAGEHMKLGQADIAADLLAKGRKICRDLDNEEYQYRFAILQAKNENCSAEQLENVLQAGLDYFKREQLFEYIRDYAEAVAVKYYHEQNHEKASKYFYISSEANQDVLKKESLK